MSATLTAHEDTAMAAVDARDIVAVRDAHGGVTVYFRDRPTHYLLEGERYRAVAPLGGVAAVPVPGRKRARGSGTPARAAGGSSVS